jgi:transcriptional regulator PpsR
MKNPSTGLDALERATGDLSGLSRWAPELAEAFVSLSSDIALVLGADGLIEKVVQSGQNPIAPSATDWVGRAWVDTVTGETRVKIENLLKEVTATGVGRRREVNHPSLGNAIPVAYTAIRLGEGGPLLAVGRDLRAVAAIQQRFLEVQRDTEQAYWRARQADSHYQLLFQVATDAMLLVDGQSLEVLEANRAAGLLFELAPEALPGRAASFGFDRHSRAALEELMTTARTSGKQAEIRARLDGKVVHTSVAVTPFRVQGATRLVLRVRLDHKPELRPLAATSPRGTEEPTDAAVVTDSTGRILTGNRSFLTLLRASSEDQIRGRSLQDWLGDGEPLAAIVERVRAQGLVQRAESSLLPTRGRALKVHVSAALLTEDDQERIGFTLLPQPVLVEVAAPALQAPALDQLTEWVGTGSLPSLLLRANAAVESLLIAEALDRSAGDATAAARLLGIDADELERRRDALSGAQRGDPAR